MARINKNIVPNIKDEVKGPISFHRLLKRRPQFGQASADLLTWCPQSLHSMSLAIFGSLDLCLVLVEA